MKDTDSFGDFPFTLSEAEEQRASRLHVELVSIDLMFQGPVGYRSFGGLDEALHAEWDQHHDVGGLVKRSIELPGEAASRGGLADYEACLRGSGLTAANFQINSFTPHDLLASTAKRFRELDSAPGVRRATVPEHIREAKRDGVTAGFLNFQAVPVAATGPDFFESARDFGVRMIGLTYNSMNTIGTGCTERIDTGVSTYGTRVIALMNQLGILVDVAHAGRQTTLDACKHSDRPVVASHAGAFGLMEHPRCKTDDELRAIAETGGVIGVVAVPFFLSSQANPTVEAMLDHLAYVADIAGIDHVALGSDWPMQLPKWVLRDVFAPFTQEIGFRQSDIGDVASNLVGFDDYRDYPNVFRGLVGRGWSDDDIAKVVGGNALRVFEATWA